MLLLWLLGLILAPVPAVAAFGDLMLRGRAGIFAAFFVGAAVWRLGIWLLPLIGLLLYTAALLAGSGGIVLAGWRQRKAGIASAAPLLPPGLGTEEAAPPDDWEPPLAPAPPLDHRAGDDDSNG